MKKIPGPERKAPSFVVYAGYMVVLVAVIALVLVILAHWGVISYN